MGNSSNLVAKELVDWTTKSRYYGYVFWSDYEEGWGHNLSIEDLPDPKGDKKSEDLRFLDTVMECEQDSPFFDHIHENKSGIYINRTWYGWEEIKHLFTEDRGFPGEGPASQLVVVVKQIVDNPSHPDDRLEMNLGLNGTREFPSEETTEEEALDHFHDTVPIGCLDDYNIWVEGTHPQEKPSTIMTDEMLAVDLKLGNGFASYGRINGEWHSVNGGNGIVTDIRWKCRDEECALLNDILESFNNDVDREES